MRKRVKIHGTKIYGRSRISNGHGLLPSIDGRSIWGRLVRDILRDLTQHCGGDGAMSITQSLAGRKVAVLEAECTFLESKFCLARAEGHEPDPVDVDRYGKLADRQRRLAESAFGWAPTARDITPSISELRKRYGDQEDSSTDAAVSAPD